MSFTSICLLVLVALIILCLLFVFFNVFFALLPVALIAILLLWLIYHFSQKRHGHDEQATVFWQKPRNEPSSSSSRKRKPARDVTTKDVDKKR
jgi:fatty acid desaturase